MKTLEQLRRSRQQAKAQLALAEMCPKKRGRAEARRLFVIATAELIRAELNHRTAAPLLRARARQRETGDLFAQIGA